MISNKAMVSILGLSGVGVGAVYIKKDYLWELWNNQNASPTKPILPPAQPPTLPESIPTKHKNTVTRDKIICNTSEKEELENVKDVALYFCVSIDNQYQTYENTTHKPKYSSDVFDIDQKFQPNTVAEGGFAPTRRLIPDKTTNKSNYFYHIKLTAVNNTEFFYLFNTTKENWNLSELKQKLK